MSITSLIIVLIVVIGIAGLGAVGFVLAGSGNGGTRRAQDVKGLMGSAQRVGKERYGRDTLEVEALKKKTGNTKIKSKKDDLGLKLFRAGYFTAEDRKRFTRFQIAAPIVTTPVFAIIFLMIGKPVLITVGLILGVFVGFSLPLSLLERQIRFRQEETLYYLPLVIEQIAIGVSSSLDIGPCISHILGMARERGTHNPVTEMFLHVEKLVRSGMGLDEALAEVADVSGMGEVKHTFMFLGQCAKHGGEISKQLQELADAVMVQRQVQIEGKIAALPVKATGPLATVFAGFFALLLAGLVVRLFGAFGSV